MNSLIEKSFVHTLRNKNALTHGDRLRTPSDQNKGLGLIQKRAIFVHFAELIPNLAVAIKKR